MMSTATLDYHSPSMSVLSKQTAPAATASSRKDNEKGSESSRPQKKQTHCQMALQQQLAALKAKEQVSEAGYVVVRTIPLHDK